MAIYIQSLVHDPHFIISNISSNSDAKIMKKMFPCSILQTYNSVAIIAKERNVNPRSIPKLTRQIIIFLPLKSHFKKRKRCFQAWTKYNVHKHMHYASSELAHDPLMSASVCMKRGATERC